jgi:hypothetical protein
VKPLPDKALSIRQPWAWAILFAGKDIENRSWQAVNHGLNQRGRIAIHASSGLGRQEYADVVALMAVMGVICPPAIELLRGGIVGSVEIVDVVKRSDSPWFFGPRGLVLRNPEPCDFIPVKGCLGFFNWRDHLTDDVPQPAPWMKQTAKPKRAPTPEMASGDLFAPKD